MKKNILLFVALFVFCSYQVFSQLSSPVLVVPPDQKDLASTTLTLDWQDVSGATGYLVDFAMTPVFQAYPPDYVNATMSQYVFSPGVLVPNQIYYWRVTAHNDAGYSVPSEIRMFKTAGTVNQEMISLNSTVNGLSISNNQKAILTNKLNHAQQKIDQQHFEQAEDKLQSFEERVQDLHESGLISTLADTSISNITDYIIAVIRTEEFKGGSHRTQNIAAKIFSLDQNYPNPFNPSTTIEYSVPVNSFVSLKIYNMLGQEVAVLINKSQDAGHYITIWDASNLGSGVYFYKLTAGNYIQTKKMLLSK